SGDILANWGPVWTDRASYLVQTISGRYLPNSTLRPDAKWDDESFRPNTDLAISETLDCASLTATAPHSR
ncbi:MAG: hypothetical protein OXD42_13785, partial [Rhodospirillaceae bacterium]|nr:hypothetical protein [Rhodospirillaceae bacterium]